MMRAVVICLASLVLLAAVPSARGETLVREFSGERSTDTAEFEVEAPWLIDWRINSDYPQSMGISVDLVDARLGTHQGRVLSTKAPGDGLRLMDQGGRFVFKVDCSLTYWTIKVIQLTREEAAQYTPKTPTGEQP